MSDSPCIIDIGAIIGGRESHQLVEMMVAMYAQWAEREGLAFEVLEKVPAFGGGLKSAKLSLSGVDRESFAALHAGAHTLLRTPPDDLNQRRHMSVAGVRVSDSTSLPLPESMAEWGAERRRYIFDAHRAINDARLGRIEVDPALIFAGNFAAIIRDAD